MVSSKDKVLVVKLNAACQVVYEKTYPLIEGATLMQNFAGKLLQLLVKSDGYHFEYKDGGFD